VLAFRQGQAYENLDERNPHKQAGFALDAARSALETVIAEKKVAAGIIDEAEDHLESTHAMSTAAEERLSLAEQQLGNLIEATHWMGFPLTAPLDVAFEDVPDLGLVHFGAPGRRKTRHSNPAIDVNPFAEAVHGV
jgi:hypothetical protein